MEKRTERVQSHAGREPHRERAQHDDRVFRVLDLRSIAYQVRGADNAERTRQAGADHKHDDRANDGEDDLGLNDRSAPRRCAAPLRSQRQGGPEQRCQRQPDHRVVNLMERMHRVIVGVLPGRGRLGLSLLPGRE